MKTLFLFLSVVSCVLFTSCNKEDEPIPLSALATDLQNGYWEIHFTSGEGMVMKFNTGTMDSYWLEETPLCFNDVGTQDYTLKGNKLTLGDNPGPATVEIQGNTLTLTWELDGFDGVFDRKLTLDYPDCN